MSSIYKKGRDGYFYYQAYVFNSDSNKKDKKVFHALGTKDLHIAKKKQEELDKKYESDVDIELSTDKNEYLFSAKATISIVLIAVIITIFIGEYLNTEDLSERINSNHPIGYNNVNQIKNNLDSQSEINKPIDKENIVVKVDSLSTEETTFRNINKLNPIIKDYNIERVDTLSGVFKQGKVYVTLDEKSSKEGQRLLCQNLTKRFKEFSNIIICLYADNEVGKKLALGNKQLATLEEQKKYWLAMYTYNSVEGEYFDNDPGSYLGN